MFRIGVVFFLFVLVTAPLFSNEPKSATREEIRRDLLSNYPPLEESSLISLPIQSTKPGKKSPALAVLFSLLLPGLGEHYAGDFGGGKYLVIAEGALWMTYATFDIYGHSLRDDARAFAILHAGINPLGKDDQFYVDLGNFINTNEFNEKRLQERSPERLYDVRAGFGWQWDSDASRAAFREKRIAGERVLDNRKFIVAAIVVNHIVSAINAARLAIAHNNALLESLGELDLKADVLGGVASPHGIRFTLTKTF